LGPKRAQSLYTWLEGHVEMLADLLAAGVQVKARSTGGLAGQSFCFTGKMKHDRGDLAKRVENAGGTVKNRVVKGLTYLVSASTTTTKAKSAAKMNIKVITEDAFLALVEAL
jgi:DNA ligase (NAD+)